jgi:hypothetical protein
MDVINLKIYIPYILVDLYPRDGFLWSLKGPTTATVIWEVKKGICILLLIVFLSKPETQCN